MNTKQCAINAITMKATRGGDGFRQWLYPGLPDNYHINEQVEKIVEQGILDGLASDQIESNIYAEYKRNTKTRQEAR